MTVLCTDIVANSTTKVVPVTPKNYGCSVFYLQGPSTKLINFIQFSCKYQIIDLDGNSFEVHWCIRCTYGSTSFGVKTPAVSQGTRVGIERHRKTHGVDTTDWKFHFRVTASFADGKIHGIWPNDISVYRIKTNQD